MRSSKHTRKTRLSALLLCLIAAAACLILPTTAYAQETEKVVRVGWYESPFNQRDAYGRRSGYSYEYQQKIAAYTGWRYEYVEGSWPELMQMLLNGEIDLMGDISYTVGRARTLLFSMLPMGSEEYYLCTSTENPNAIDSRDMAPLNGKKIGVNKGSVQEDMLRSWMAKKGVEAEIVELMVNEDTSVDMLNRGELDAFVTINGFRSADTLSPVFKIGASDIYFAVSKKRPELLKELDAAMLCIQ